MPYDKSAWPADPYATGHDDEFTVLGALLADEQRKLGLFRLLRPHIGHALAVALDDRTNVICFTCETCDSVLMDLQGEYTDVSE